MKNPPSHLSSLNSILSPSPFLKKLLSFPGKASFLLLPFLPISKLSGDPFFSLHPLPLSSPVRLVSQGSLLTPRDSLTEGYLPPPTSPFYSLLLSPEGSSFVGGWEVWGVTLQAGGFYEERSEKNRFLTFTPFQTLTTGGTIHIFTTEETFSLSTLQKGGGRIGIRWETFFLGAGAYFQKIVKSNPSFSVSFPDITISGTESVTRTTFFPPNAPPGKFIDRGEGIREDTKKIFWIEGGKNSPLFLAVSLSGEERSEKESLQRVKEDLSFRRDLTETRLLGRGTISSGYRGESFLFAIGGEYGTILGRGISGGDFFTGPVPPYSLEEWAREWEIPSSGGKEIQGKIGFLFQNTWGRGRYGVSTSFLGFRLIEEGTLKERLRLRRTGGVPERFGEGEGGSTWEEKREEKGGVFTLGGGVEGDWGEVTIGGGGGIRYLLLRKGEERKPTSLSPVTGTEQMGGVVDPLFLPYPNISFPSGSSLTLTETIGEGGIYLTFPNESPLKGTFLLLSRTGIPPSSGKRETLFFIELTYTP